MTRTVRLLSVVFAIIAGCASAPKSQSKISQLEKDAVAAKNQMIAEDPGLQSLIDQGAGYIIFPEIKQGGFIVGAAKGVGVIFEDGKYAGMAELSQGSVGAQVGGQKFAELIISRDKFTLDKIKSGSFDMGAQASAVILRQGEGSAAQFGDSGVAVIVNPISGAMVSASITGQQIKAKM
jgi:lipid-binding SYLF domain-containing protein